MVQRWCLVVAVLVLNALKEFEFVPREVCTSLEGLFGRCIRLSQCGSLSDIYHSQVLTIKQSERLADSLCGRYRRNPFVCCIESGKDLQISKESEFNSPQNWIVSPERKWYGPAYPDTQYPTFNTKYHKEKVPKYPIEPENNVQLRTQFPDPPIPEGDSNPTVSPGQHESSVQQTELDEFPWSALIQYRKPYGILGFHCGGTLINERHVLTAAHCIKAIPNTWEVYRVRLGEYDVKNEGSDCVNGNCSDNPLDVDIAQVIVHPKYVTRQPSQYDDIALLHLAKDVQTSNYVRPISLPSPTAVNDGTMKAISAGWGRTITASASAVKLKVYLDMDDAYVCSEAYKLSGVKLRDKQLCASEVRFNGVCSCDSGGPLMLEIDGQYRLIGIGSFGPAKCGMKTVPGIYTNVAKYVDWIASNMR